MAYRMPAEWEPHRSTWLAWPHKLSDWPGKFAPIPWVYAEIVRVLARFEPVNLLVKDSAHGEKVRAILRANDAEANVKLHTVPTNRSWVRDSGPIFVHDRGNVVALDWRFNAWAKYPDWPVDDKIPTAVAKRAKTPRVEPKFNGKRIVLEGGGVDVNGAGCVLVTEEWLLSDIQVRNPGFSRADYESIFAQYLGSPKTIWLGDGIVGDDTHGHIDDTARFTDENTIVTCYEKNESDENFPRLHDNWQRLKSATDPLRQKFEIVKLPMPRPVVFKGQRLPASYANFYIANGAVLVPTFNDPHDRLALGILADLFRGREVIGIHCGDLIWGLGTLHCLSQQEPANLEDYFKESATR
jgi:agmatine deiminase